MRKLGFGRLIAMVLAMAMALSILPAALAESLLAEDFGVTETVMEKLTVPYVRDFG